jgi:hypothetical protein
MPNLQAVFIGGYEIIFSQKIATMALFGHWTAAGLHHVVLQEADHHLHDLGYQRGDSIVGGSVYIPFT